MKITARRDEGLSGRHQCLELDTTCHAGGAALEELVRKLDFFGAAPPRVLGADLPRWEITVEDGARCRSLVLVDDGSLAATGWPALLAHLAAQR